MLNNDYPVWCNSHFDSHRFICLYLFKDSNTVWEFKTGYPITATPVVAGEHVYIGSDKFYCLDRRTGKVVWQFETSVPMSSSAVLADGCVYFQCGGLYCFDAATGKLTMGILERGLG